MTSSRRADWLVPTALIALTLIPMAGGAMRLTDLAGGEVTPENARFFAAPAPVVLHIVGAVLYCLGGAFQFAPGFRRRHRAGHRVLGRVLVPAGLLMALTGLWMTLFYPYPEGDGDLLAAFRLVTGSATVLALVLGVRAILRRDVVRHRAWMIRAYAIAQGAGTQALVTIAWVVLVGPATGLTRTLLLGLGWLINIAVAEWLIGEPARGRRTLYRARRAERTA
ncbi:DUF2306 domain-containing protein [Saccharothrix luteola]|uniref:DUF2306 domain-containing protein n=1 Tax=Saccharothrix luteola TaxID=2893018 RepID=UPI001E5E4B12|nr:DUF2306 domain-containing protein [Saccharothrix luteola]MCC8244045.1 DUF2306 domain-containing protein [Saccharothrix luteola]